MSTTTTTTTTTTEAPTTEYEIPTEVDEIDNEDTEMVKCVLGTCWCASPGFVRVPDSKYCVRASTTTETTCKLDLT